MSTNSLTSLFWLCHTIDHDYSSHHSLMHNHHEEMRILGPNNINFQIRSINGVEWTTNVVMFDNIKIIGYMSDIKLNSKQEAIDSCIQYWQNHR